MPCQPCIGARVLPTAATAHLFTTTAQPGDLVETAVRGRPSGVGEVVAVYLTPQAEERVDVKLHRTVITLRLSKGDTVTPITADVPDPELAEL
jgi:hypothetical protein